jgi:hypothetical protein
MAESIAESARKASAGSWRKPRMKIYDYNQEFGGNYYQPMIEYINTKNIQGPFHERKEIYMPNQAEVTSDKFTNMRYNDKSSTSLDLENFLVDAYAKQIKELNSSTASAHYQMIHNSKNNSCYGDTELLGGFVRPTQAKKMYTRELSALHQVNLIGEDLKLREAERQEAELAWKERQRERWCKEEELSPKTKEEINNVRTKLFWVYQTRDPKEFKQWLE